MSWLEYLLSLLKPHRKLSVLQELLLSIFLESVLVCIVGCLDFLTADEEQFICLLWQPRRAVSGPQVRSYQEKDKSCRVTNEVVGTFN